MTSTSGPSSTCPDGPAREAARDARQHDGALVVLADQDRSRWHHDEIRAGLELAAVLSPTIGYAEELRLQALIAAEHARTRDARTTDWAAIATHYADLEAHTSSPIVRLNRAVAVAEADGARAGLDLLAGLDDVLGAHHRLPAVRAELARRLGDTELAHSAYRAAIERCDNDTERAHLRAARDAVHTVTPAGGHRQRPAASPEVFIRRR